MNKIFDSAEQTYEFGYNLASSLRGGEIILLYGEMGCGKTILTKGIAAGLNIKDEILSPTFTIMNEYKGGRLKLFHFDAYRLVNASQAEETGLSDYIGLGDAVTVIEWPEVLMPILKNYKYKTIRFEYLNENSREVIYDE